MGLMLQPGLVVQEVATWPRAGQGKRRLRPGIGVAPITGRLRPQPGRCARDQRVV